MGIPGMYTTVGIPGCTRGGVYTRDVHGEAYIPGGIHRWVYQEGYTGGYTREVSPWWVYQGCNTDGYTRSVTQVGIPRVYLQDVTYPGIYQGVQGVTYPGISQVCKGCTTRVYLRVCRRCTTRVYLRVRRGTTRRVLSLG